MYAQSVVSDAGVFVDVCGPGGETYLHGEYLTRFVMRTPSKLSRENLQAIFTLIYVYSHIMNKILREITS